MPSAMSQSLMQLSTTPLTQAYLMAAVDLHNLMFTDLCYLHTRVNCGCYRFISQKWFPLYFSIFHKKEIYLYQKIIVKYLRLLP